MSEKKKRFTAEDFTYDKKNDVYTCPCGNALRHTGYPELRNNSGNKYQTKRGTCVNCPRIKECINVKKSRNPVRTLYIIDRKYEENLSEKMRDKIDDPAYREIYSRRQQIIEPVFADIVSSKGMDRFTLRTKRKMTAQWQLYCIVHNILKCVKPLEKKYGA